MNDPGPKFVLQQIMAELYDGASAMKNSLLQVSPSKKNTCASQGVGAGVTGDSVGDSVSMISGWQISSKSQDNVPKTDIQHI